MTRSYISSRRAFLKGTAAAVGAGAFATTPLRGAFSQDFPSRTMGVTIPTREGGAADLYGRLIGDHWARSLGQPFEFEFFPGAGGQVGYETYIHRRDRDGHELLFGNMGPEVIMYVLQDPNYDFPGDYNYFIRTNVDDSTLFVRQDSPFESIEQVIDEAKKREVTVSTSRLPHPASIGMLALAEETGAKINLVPYGGGGPTSLAVINAEVDCGILPSVVPIRLGDQVRVLGVWSDENKLASQMGDPPSINAVFGTSIPDLPSAWAWAIHAEAMEKHPERYERLVETGMAVFEDPEFQKAVEDSGTLWDFFQPGDRDAAMSYANNMVEMTDRFKAVLTGS